MTMKNDAGKGSAQKHKSESGKEVSKKDLGKDEGKDLGKGQGERSNEGSTAEGREGKQESQANDGTSPDGIDHSENPLDSNKSHDKNDQNANRHGNVDPTSPANPAYRK